MKLSNYLLPTLKEDPREAQIPSHRLMIRAGLIRQLASGIYNWLPLGFRVLKNVERIVREELDESGCVEMLMPTMQPAELWKKSGRGDYGKETLLATDRHGNSLIYGPTNEEVITDLFASNVKSYKNLPLNLYHIQWKFRDEIRPRFGVMRGREFYMKDAYSFDLDKESAIKSYDRMFETYLKIFRRMGLKAIPFRAETGQIGGDLSHEFQVIAKTGESEIIYDSSYDDEFDKGVPSIEKLKNVYARTAEMHDEAACDVDKEQLVTSRGIEVGHIFYLGDKYSSPMGAKVQMPDGSEQNVHMGCYGIGVSRLVGAIIEANHDENGIIWPENIAPFPAILVNVKPGDESVDEECNKIYQDFHSRGIEILYDDVKEGAGAKFSRADLIGIPYQISVGPRSVKNGVAEIKNRVTGEKSEVNFSEIQNFFK